MRNLFTILTVGLVLAGTLPLPQAQAAGEGMRPQAQNPQRPQTCRPKWPYVQLSCVA